MSIYKKLFDIKKEGIKLQRDTKAFNYKYADLSQIQTKMDPLFEKYNVLAFHSVQDGSVETMIIDLDTNDNVVSKIKLSEGVKAQDKGSEITYYRRYNLLCLLDLGVEDDDGKSAMKLTKKCKMCDKKIADDKTYCSEPCMKKDKNETMDNFTK